jgi:hypothetical protein
MEIGNDALQLLEAGINFLDLAAQLLNLAVKIVATLIGMWELALGRIVFALVATAQVLSEIFLARESVAGAAVAIFIGTHQGLLGVVLLVDLTLVA